MLCTRNAEAGNIPIFLIFLERTIVSSPLTQNASRIRRAIREDRVIKTIIWAANLSRYVRITLSLGMPMENSRD